MDIKRTKIICSIGPASEEVDTLVKLIDAGMNVVRLNFSHGSYEEYTRIKENLEKARKKTKKYIGLLYDTKGPDFRLGEIENGSIDLKEGETIKLLVKGKIGSKDGLVVNYSSVVKKLDKGDKVLFDDGLIVTEVVKKTHDGVILSVISAGTLLSHKGVAVPGVELDIDFLSKQDKEDIKFACENDGDFLALSFVNCKEDVLKVRKLIEENNSSMQIISKIESQNAIKNLDEIIEVSDGIMVARGDLGVEFPVEKLPIIQKMIIQRCREQGKTCIVATEMLASMATSPRPTRAEVSDIANAVLDGCDAVMLSGETTIGKHPVEAVKYMSNSCREAEEYYDYDFEFEYDHDKAITAAIAKAVIAAIDEVNAKAVVVPTMGGHSARVISNLKPEPIIIATCTKEKVARGLSLSFGVVPYVVDFIDDFNDLIKVSKKVSKSALDLQEGDVIIVTGGIHSKSEPNQTNFLKIEEIK